MAAVRCNNQARNIYVDEQLAGSTEDVEDIWSQGIASDTRLITVECHNTVYSGGLIVSIDNRFTTGTTWRCSSREDGWYNLDFDDSDWDEAYVIQSNYNPTGSGVWAKDNNFPDHEWIWKDQN